MDRNESHTLRVATAASSSVLEILYLICWWF